MVTIKGTIISKGRKYFKINVTGDKHQSDLVINEVTKELKPDDEFELSATYEFKNRRIYTAYAVDKVAEVEAARWFGYIKTTFEKDGYLYKRGIEELEKLECHKYDEEIAEIKSKTALKQQTERCEKAIGYIRDTYARYGYLYKKGVETLEQYECHDYDEEIKKMETDIAAAKVKKEKEYEDTHKRFVFSTDEYSHYSQLDGRIIVKGDKAYKIIKAYYNKYDGLSFGVRTEDFYRATGVDITNTSEGKTAIEKNIAEKAERKQIAERKNYFKSKIDELKKIIMDNDELVSECALIKEMLDTEFDNGIKIIKVEKVKGNPSWEKYYVITFSKDDYCDVEREYSLAGWGQGIPKNIKDFINATVDFDDIFSEMKEYE